MDKPQIHHLFITYQKVAHNLSLLMFGETQKVEQEMFHYNFKHFFQK